MTIPRIITEQNEKLILSEYATLSAETKGRIREEKQCDLRSDFQRDRDRIIHSKAFRRLKHKTQVFLSPESDHYRTRLTHTLEVSQIARTMARALRLNEDLTEAIALGHDLGHTPFGHAGERALNEILPFDFTHYEQSVRVCERIEKGGRGLNLTYEVLNGKNLRFDLIKTYKVCNGDTVVLASDGYPVLKATLSESEHELNKVIKENPLCNKGYLSTKGLKKGNLSFDDRTYIKFIV
jgi:dGTP triphosphohydrolase